MNNWEMPSENAREKMPWLTFKENLFEAGFDLGPKVFLMKGLEQKWLFFVLEVLKIIKKLGLKILSLVPGYFSQKVLVQDALYLL